MSVWLSGSITAVPNRPGLTPYPPTTRQRLSGHTRGRGRCAYIPCRSGHWLLPKRPAPLRRHQSSSDTTTSTGTTHRLVLPAGAPCPGQPSASPAECGLGTGESTTSFAGEQHAANLGLAQHTPGGPVVRRIRCFATWRSRLPQHAWSRTSGRAGSSSAPCRRCITAATVMSMLWRIRRTRPTSRSAAFQKHCARGCQAVLPCIPSMQDNVRG